MLIKQAPEIRESEVTPRELYLRRREFLGAAGVAAAAVAGNVLTPGDGFAQNPAAQKLLNLKKRSFSTTEPLNSYRDVTTYNNFYEFGLDKGDPAKYAQRAQAAAVVGEGGRGVRQAGHLQHRGHPQVVPARGAHLPAALRRGVVDGDPVDRLPARRLHQAHGADGQGQVHRVPHPGRLQADAGTDRAGAAVAVSRRAAHGRGDAPAGHPRPSGLYGEVLPNQNGAPIRLVVPWKYGFKSIKSIVSVKFIEREPLNTWQQTARQEYGFYANVNPAVDHPRWTQASERRIGEFFRRKTLPFNGYGDQVASLYAGMDLRRQLLTGAP